MLKKQDLPSTYPAFLKELKDRIQSARLKAALSVNRELVLLYWSIGRDILAKQSSEGWGGQVIDRLSKDLRREFPGTKGFSLRNLKYMRAFAESCKNEEFVHQLGAQIPWKHNCTLLEKIKDREQREWYVQAIIEYGWSRNVLVHQIESRLYERQGKALTNFSRTLPAPDSDLAQQVTKNSYSFDFLGVGHDVKERKLERGLVENIRAFILELGKGFAFVGSQYHIEVDDEDYYLDLLFYHYRLHCFVVFDLKTGKFKPEYAGKMNFYLSAVDDMLRSPEDKPSIGIVLCKTHKALTAEYAFRDMTKPMGVSEYRLTSDLPQRLEDALPTAEELTSQMRSQPRGKRKLPRPNDSQTARSESKKRVKFEPVDS